MFLQSDDASFNTGEEVFVDGSADTQAVIIGRGPKL